jgi:hypothetical protein
MEENLEYIKESIKVDLGKIGIGEDLANAYINDQKYNSLYKIINDTSTDLSKEGTEKTFQLYNIALEIITFEMDYESRDFNDLIYLRETKIEMAKLRIDKTLKKEALDSHDIKTLKICLKLIKKEEKKINYTKK